MSRLCAIPFTTDVPGWGGGPGTLTRRPRPAHRHRAVRLAGPSTCTAPHAGTTAEHTPAGCAAGVAGTLVGLGVGVTALALNLPSDATAGTATPGAGRRPVAARASTPTSCRPSCARSPSARPRPPRPGRDPLSTPDDRTPASRRRRRPARPAADGDAPSPARPTAPSTRAVRLSPRPSPPRAHPGQQAAFGRPAAVDGSFAGDRPPPPPRRLPPPPPEAVLRAFAPPRRASAVCRTRPAAGPGRRRTASRPVVEGRRPQRPVARPDAPAGLGAPAVYDEDAQAGPVVVDAAGPPQAPAARPLDPALGARPARRPAGRRRRRRPRLVPHPHRRRDAAARPRHPAVQGRARASPASRARSPTSPPASRPPSCRSRCGSARPAPPAPASSSTARKGYIVTNNHVVSGADGVEGAEIRAVFSDGSGSAARIVGRDPASDIAVLKVEKPGLVTASLGTLEGRRRRRPGGGDRLTAGPGRHRHQRHRQRARPAGPAVRGGQRHQRGHQRRADRRPDQPRQLRRRAGRRAPARSSASTPRSPRSAATAAGRLDRPRLRHPDRHRPRHRPAAHLHRQGGARARSGSNTRSVTDGARDGALVLNVEPGSAAADRRHPRAGRRHRRRRQAGGQLRGARRRRRRAQPRRHGDRRARPRRQLDRGPGHARPA